MRHVLELYQSFRDLVYEWQASSWAQDKLEGTHRVRTHAALCILPNPNPLTLTLTFDLSTPKPCHFYDIPR